MVELPTASPNLGPGRITMLSGGMDPGTEGRIYPGLIVLDGYLKRLGDLQWLAWIRSGSPMAFI